MNAQIWKASFPGVMSVCSMRNRVLQSFLLSLPPPMETSHSKSAKVVRQAADGRANSRRMAKNLARRWAMRVCFPSTQFLPTTRTLYQADLSYPFSHLWCWGNYRFQHCQRNFLNSGGQRILGPSASRLLTSRFQFCSGLGSIEKWAWFGYLARSEWS